MPSVTASLLESMADLPEADVPQQEETIRNAGAIAYLAGSDTVRPLFLLHSVHHSPHCSGPPSLYPDVQRKVQRELDYRCRSAPYL
ncbi:hypothetical protein JB92DRAFT_2877572 [Gautieria morchelliformis]|nr:hypothetical protein JB92DRAFT_2877572 [Gautieria morchelliformis]